VRDLRWRESAGCWTVMSGRISEGAVTNVGLWRDGTVIWPEAPKLAGVTMLLLRRQLTAAGIRQAEEPVRVPDLIHASAHDNCGTVNSPALDTKGHWIRAGGLTLSECVRMGVYGAEIEGRRAHEIYPRSQPRKPAMKDPRRNRLRGANLDLPGRSGRVRQGGLALLGRASLAWVAPRRSWCWPRVARGCMY
jgi:hypothetical protein